MRSGSHRHSNNETPEPIKRAVTASIQVLAGLLILVAIVLIIEYVTDPQVRTFQFLFR